MKKSPLDVAQARLLDEIAGGIAARIGRIMIRLYEAPDLCPVCGDGLSFRVTDVECHQARWSCYGCDSEWDECGTGYVLRGEFVDEVYEQTEAAS